MENPTLINRRLGDCFYLVTDLSKAQEEIDLSLQHSLKVEQAVGAMLSGRASADDMLDMIYDCIPNMDAYLDEVENNLADVEDLLYEL